MSSPELENLVSQLHELSPNDQRELQQILSAQLGNGVTARGKMTEEEFEHNLDDQGDLLDIPPPTTDLTKTQLRDRVTVQGEPLSQTIISERR